MTISIPLLRDLLVDLHFQPYEQVENPPSTNKRASIALILRIRPTYGNPPPRASPPSPSHEVEPAGASQDADTEPAESAEPSAPAETADPTEAIETHATPTTPTVNDRLAQFFSQDWVQKGRPEVLFIKRTSRQTDRWGGHIALPGGRRDPEDADDHAAAVRETEEEVGLTLVPEGENANCISVGGLPQRLLTAGWGNRPLMVLCPYIFVLTTPDTPSLTLQPTEVHSAHWVSLENLTDPSNRVIWRQEVGNRYLAHTKYLQTLSNAILGPMLFAAFRLVPTESIFSPSELAPPPPTRSLLPRLDPVPPPSPTDVPLHLWGLTLGIVADLFDLHPLHASPPPTAHRVSQTLRFFIWPTFAAWDIRLIIYLLSRRFRATRGVLVAGGPPGTLHRRGRSVDVVVDADSAAVRPDAADHMRALGLDTFPNRMRAGNRSMIIFDMLNGYHRFIRQGIYIALAVRAAVTVALVVLAYRRRDTLKALWTRYVRS